jgi:hypothetical protein
MGRGAGLQAAIERVDPGRDDRVIGLVLESSKALVTEMPTELPRLRIRL